MSRIVQTVVTVVVTVAATLALLAGLTWQRMSNMNSQPLTPYRTGDRIQPLPGFDFAEHRYTLLLAVSRRCTTCDETLALYRQICAQVESRRFIRLVWVSSDPEELTADFLHASALPEGRILRVNPAAVRLSALPSVVLVDSSGVIQRIWAGRKAIDDRGEVIAALANLGAG